MVQLGTALADSAGAGDLDSCRPAHAKMVIQIFPVLAGVGPHDV
jgi:hypothetical protein